MNIKKNHQIFTDRLYFCFINYYPIFKLRLFEDDSVSLQCVWLVIIEPL